MQKSKAKRFSRVSFLLSLVLPVSCTLAIAQSSVPKGELSIADAKQYMLSLINRDRKSLGLKEVVADETAERAGNLHSDEMARLGYLSHWNTSGQKPDQRYCEAGGTGFVMENGHIEFSGYADDAPGANAEFKLDPAATISKRDIDDIESGFFNEKPPNDGHRRNILDPDHTKVGIGLSVARKGDSFRIACAQEFIHSYGKVEAAPMKLKVGESFTVKGSLDPGLKLSSVDLFWEELPAPMTLKQLDETHSYGPPQMRVNTYFPNSPAAQGHLSISENGGRQEFNCRFDTESATWKPGLYYVYVWTRTPEESRIKPLCVASKTIEVR
ncbi:MAG: CAP domain-containing protein [Candidatus Obscuribacterales bacterium]|nr:CAP domain-containing protein [Candidatus Obscuribacterales bacterium]